MAHALLKRPLRVPPRRLQYRNDAISPICQFAEDGHIFLYSHDGVAAAQLDISFYFSSRSLLYITSVYLVLTCALLIQILSPSAPCALEPAHPVACSSRPTTDDVQNRSLAHLKVQRGHVRVRRRHCERRADLQHLPAFVEAWCEEKRTLLTSACGRGVCILRCITSVRLRSCAAQLERAVNGTATSVVTRLESWVGRMHVTAGRPHRWAGTDQRTCNDTLDSSRALVMRARCLAFLHIEPSVHRLLHPHAQFFRPSEWRRVTIYIS
ncbi:hypothetical protein DFH06DRAFT_1349426 [Mycena polygramma]|nr:hypothetical protein DFH06DRAFT_1349426 [Mycena polygramma]